MVRRVWSILQKVSQNLIQFPVGPTKAHLVLKDELETSMRLCGITDIDEAHPGLVNTQDIDHLVANGEDHGWIKWRPRAKI